MNTYRFTFSFYKSLPGVCLVILFILLSSANTWASYASFYYVSVSGNDANPGTVDAPFRTIQRAVDACEYGGYITVAAGRYMECINIQGKSVKLIGNPGNPSSTIIDGNQQGPVITMKDNPMSGAFIQGFTITGGKATGVYPDNHGGGIFLHNTYILELMDVIITGNEAEEGAAVAVQLNGTCLIMSNTLIYGNSSTSVGGSIIRYNRVGSAGCLMKNVTIADNYHAGATIKTTNSGVSIKSSIVRNPEIPAELEASDLGYTHEYLYSNIRGYWTLSGMKQGLIDTDPLFVDPAKGKYQLFDNSPCVDAGGVYYGSVQDQRFPPCRGSSATDMGAYGGATLCAYDQAIKIVYSYDASGNQEIRKRIRLTSIGPVSLNRLNEWMMEEDPAVASEELPEMKIPELKIYPNPTRGWLRIEFYNLPPDPTIISLYDSRGHLIKKWTEAALSYEIDISGHPDGVYFMQIMSGSDSNTWKIVKD